MRDFAYLKFKHQLQEWFRRNRPEWKVGKWTKAKLEAVYLKEMLKGIRR